MKRQDKYPETSTFHYYNANPKNKITGDCVIRALCTAMEEPYEIVYVELLKFSLKCGYMLDDKNCYDKYLQLKGWIKHSQPRKLDNTKYTGEEFCRRIADKKIRYIAHVGGHHIVAIVNGKINDIWDSTDGCIGNYWTKG